MATRVGFNIEQYTPCKCDPCQETTLVEWSYQGEVKYAIIDLDPKDWQWIEGRHCAIWYGNNANCEEHGDRNDQWIFSTEGICESDENFDVAAAKFLQELINQEKYLATRYQ